MDNRPNPMGRKRGFFRCKTVERRGRQRFSFRTRRFERPKTLRILYFRRFSGRIFCDKRKEQASSKKRACGSPKFLLGRDGISWKSSFFCKKIHRIREQKSFFRGFPLQKVRCRGRTFRPWKVYSKSELYFWKGRGRQKRNIRSPRTLQQGKSWKNCGSRRGVFAGILTSELRIMSISFTMTCRFFIKEVFFDV